MRSDGIGAIEICGRDRYRFVMLLALVIGIILATSKIPVLL
jgi:hypothetical protein